MEYLDIDIKETADYYDIKDEYINKLKVGEENEEITSELIEEYEDYINEGYVDSFVFWLALAEVQWDYGRLLPRVREEANKSIKEIDLDKVEDYARKDIIKILNKINSPQKAERKVGKLKMDKTCLKEGDIYAYKLHLSDYYREKFPDRYSKYDGKYIVFKNVLNEKHGLAGLPKDEYYNEYSRLAIYSWLGDYIPTYQEIKDIEFIKDFFKEKYPFEVLALIGVCSFTEKKLKTLDFTYIRNEGIDNEIFKRNDYPYTFIIMSNNGDEFSEIVMTQLFLASEYGNLIEGSKDNN